MMTSIKLFSGEIELLKVEDIAKALDVNMETIRRYIRKGKLKAQKIGKRYYVSKENLITFTNGTFPTEKAQK
jgi:excisionase family DNA binding protein